VQKKYQIFVSSTFTDLKDERQDAIRSILDLGHIPAGMELFPAADVEQLSYIKKIIDECDYYLLIMGGRYGSLDAEGVSFTEREYDYAVETGKVVLAFPHGDTTAIPVGKSDTSPRMTKNLEDFRAKVMTGRIVRQWTSRENLESVVLKALVHATSTHPAVGWVRADTVASEALLLQNNSLRSENDRLNAEMKRLSEQSMPKLENLASLDAELTVHYTYMHYNEYDEISKNGKQAVTWADMVGAVGPAATAPTTRGAIEHALETWLREVFEISHSIDLISIDRDIIINQLSALGYLHVFSVANKSGGGQEFIQITELGQAKMTELLAVRA
jgi:hypothetical protein